MQPHRHSPRPLATGSIARGLLCAVLGFSVAGAQNPPPEESGGEAEREQIGFLESEMLRDGSILKGVTLPSYDRSLKLTSVVRADEMVIVSEERINAKNMLIEMFDDNGVPDARIAMKRARYLPSRKMLISDEPVSILSNKLTANGSALVFDTAKTRGFLHGPVKAVTELDLQTSMNAKPARHAFAAGALLMAAATPLPAQEPKEPTAAERFAELRLKPEELQQISAEAASKKAELSETSGSAKAAMDLVDSESEDARVTMNGFFRVAALTSLMAEPAPPASGEAVPLPPIPENPLKTTITSKDGAYFDSAAGLAIFLKDVEVKNPEFQLKGADELKIFMTPEPEEDENPKPKDKGAPEGAAADKKPAGDPSKPKASGKPAAETVEITPELAEKMRAGKEAAAKLGKQGDKADFGDVKRLVATGVVEIFYQPKKTSDGKEQEPIMASARTVVYDIEKEQIILRGGSPWVLKGKDLQRVNGEDAYWLISTKNGEPTKFVTGNQESFEGEFTTPPKEDDKKGKNGQKGQNQKPQTPKNR